MLKNIVIGRIAIAKQAKHSDTEPVYEVMWPLGRAVSELVTPSSPVSDLRGKTVGELWDWLFKGDEMFSIIRGKLQEQYPVSIVASGFVPRFRATDRHRGW